MRFSDAGQVTAYSEAIHSARITRLSESGQGRAKTMAFSTGQAERQSFRPSDSAGEAKFPMSAYYVKVARRYDPNFPDRRFGTVPEHVR